MFNISLKSSQVLLASVVLAAASQVFAADQAQMRKADGLIVYYGVMPAEMIAGHEMEHGGANPGKGSHHLVISVFDAASGKRVEDAQVSASVSAPGLAPETKRLDAMKIADTVTYGQFFRMTGKEPYRIAVEIRRPGTPKPAKVSFEYRHP